MNENELKNIGQTVIAKLEYETRQWEKKSNEYKAAILALESQRIRALFPDLSMHFKDINWSQVTAWDDEDIAIFIYIPWDKILADDILRLFAMFGWKITDEKDYKKHYGHYKFVLKHSDTHIEVNVEMQANLAGSKCELKIIGHKTIEKPIYEIICAEAEQEL